MTTTRTERIGRGSLRALAVQALAAAALCLVTATSGSAGEVDNPARKSAQGSAGIYHVQPTDDRIDVKITLHKSETVRVGMPFSEALVGNAEVADVVPLTDRSIYIVGKKIGVTRIALLDVSKQLLGVVDVEVTYDLDGLKARLSGNPALDDVQVSSVNGKILLTGVVPDAVAMQHAMTLAKQISESDITNAMRVASPQQVMLEVRFIEANRQAAHALGADLTVVGNRAFGVTNNGSIVPDSGIGVDSSGDYTNNVLRDIAGGLVGNAIPFGTFAAKILAGGTEAEIAIRALEERGLARRLAEPNLVALSGDTASFLAGGEFPFPVSNDDDKIEVEFKKFGVGLAFTPTVLSEGQINLKIEPEVSDLDPTNFIKVGNVEIPSLTVRRASTTVELRDGQSFAIAGLLQSNHAKNHRQLPWIGDVPIIGALLRSAAWEKNETDLVIIVTPRLVQPRAPGKRLATPLDKTVPTADKEYFLSGVQEVEVGQPDQFVGHIIDLTDEEAVSGGYKGAKE